MSSPLNPTREKILKAAWELLEARTGHPARMSDIAKKAGVSRQALYLHFPNRTELFVETTKYMDQVFGIQDRLTESREAATGEARLDAYIRAWAWYVPKVFGIAKTLMTMAESDEDAATAWNDRAASLREGCAAAVRDITRDGQLKKGLDEKEATDLLWSLLLIPNWENLVIKCGWSEARYLEVMRNLARSELIEPGA